MCFKIETICAIYKAIKFLCLQKICKIMKGGPLVLNFLPVFGFGYKESH
jgi:hypothetical protein